MESNNNVKKRRGFLPIETNMFDRIFMGLIIHIAINLLWMRFLEQWIPLYVATLLGLSIIFIIVKWGG